MTFALEVWYDQGICTLYTVRKEDASIAETDKFFLAAEKHVQHQVELQKLLILILKQIGDKHGALPVFFSREEHNVIALPHSGRRVVKEVTHYFPNFPFRLFALRISNNIAILFNGGLKTSQSLQGSPDLRVKWQEANRMALAIIEALKDGTLWVQGNSLKSELPLSEVWLHS